MFHPWAAFETASTLPMRFEIISAMKTTLRPVAAFAAAFTTLGLHAGDAPKPVELKFATPGRGEIHRFVTLPGSIKANRQATLYAKVGGYLKTISVDKGDSVQAGQLLAEIDVPELAAEAARHQAEIARAKAEAVRYRAEADLAALELKRLSDAVKKSPDLVVQQTVDAAKASATIAKAKQSVAAAEQQAAEANLKRVETQMSFTRITAPFTGVITSRHVDAGAYIASAASGSAGQTAAIVTLMDFDKVRVHVPVTELEAPLVAVDQPVRVAVEGLPGRAFEGTVTRHSYALDEASKTMLVEAEMLNPSRQLRPGMYAIVKVGVEKHKDVLTVPVEALVMEKANAFLFLLVDGKAKKTAVKIGFNDGKQVEIASGADAKAKVLLVGKLTLADGQAVNATEGK
jgi:membrane fusion protein (multidrug efflux system)